jgi:hypothetical protein
MIKLHEMIKPLLKMMKLDWINDQIAWNDKTIVKNDEIGLDKLPNLNTNRINLNTCTHVCTNNNTNSTNFHTNSINSNTNPTNSHSHSINLTKNFTKTCICIHMVTHTYTNKKQRNFFTYFIFHFRNDKVHTFPLVPCFTFSIFYLLEIHMKC